MTDKPPHEDEPGAEERFDRAIKNALAMKPTPHVKKGAKNDSDTKRGGKGTAGRREG